MSNLFQNGRKRIYTDEEVITKSNVCQVLSDSIPEHEINKGRMKMLLDFEKGEQPLQREKTVRPEIDIVSVSNIANEITEFKLGYFWGNPIAMVQKSDKIPVGQNAIIDNSAISILNNMYNAENKDSKDQELARYVEICGVGYQMIDVKRDYEDGDSPFDLITLNPLYTFVVYSSDIYHKPMMGVTYTEKKNREKTFYCYTDDSFYIINSQYKIENGKVDETKVDYKFGDRSGELNPLGEVNIIEFNRSYDRTGCFERQIEELNALNILESDLVNDVSQNTQAIWWGNDIKLEEDDDGNVTGVKGGQWILTGTNQNAGSKPDIKPLVLQYDYSGVIQNINTKHDYILERAYVPKQSDPGGGSTGTAMSLSSGWSAAEAVACKEALVLKKTFSHRNRLVIKAIMISPDVAPENPVLKLTANDIDIRFIRQKTFDMATKVNSLSTMLKCMVEPRTAMAAIDFFPNLAEAVDDSIDMMKEYQKNLLKNTSTTETEKKEMPDMSDQKVNSPVANI